MFVQKKKTFLQWIILNTYKYSTVNARLPAVRDKTDSGKPPINENTGNISSINILMSQYKLYTNNKVSALNKQYYDRHVCGKSHASKNYGHANTFSDN